MLGERESSNGQRRTAPNSGKSHDREMANSEDARPVIGSYETGGYDNLAVMFCDEELGLIDDPVVDRTPNKVTHASPSLGQLEAIDEEISLRYTEEDSIRPSLAKVYGPYGGLSSNDEQRSSEDRNSTEQQQTLPSEIISSFQQHCCISSGPEESRDQSKVEELELAKEEEPK